MPQSPHHDVASAIRVTVRFAAGLMPAPGAARETVLLYPGSKVRDLRSELMRLHPDLAGGLRSALLVANGDHALPARRLADGDEVACLAPMAGGQQVPCTRSREGSGP